MHARARGRRRVLGLAGGLAVVLTAWNNLVVPRLPGSYVVANLAAATAVGAAGRAAGLTWHELGLSRRRLRAGLRGGGPPAAAVAAGYATALAVPALRPLLADARVGALDGAQVAHQTLVRVPLGTVLWEEVAFRGVLLAALERLLTQRAAVAADSALFGIWHVRPTYEALAANDVVRGPVRTTGAVLLGCSGTAAAGVLFCRLRLRSGSLLAPVLLHLATNSLGTLAAAAAVRLSRRRRGTGPGRRPSARGPRR
ncbi:lysostaphin resistance A-like protein [Geodermatophilus sp. SYSU D00691]